MNKKQQQIVAGGVVACLLLLVAGYFLLVRPKKSQVSTVKSQTAAENSANATLRGQIAMLQQQQAGLVGKQVVLRQVAQRIPSDPQIPSLIRQLTQIQASTGVDVVSITPGTPTAATPAATAATTPVASAATAGSGASSTTGSSAVHPTAAGSAAATYQTIPITLSVQGNYSQLVMFLDHIENLQRLYLVKGLTLTPVKSGTAATATVKTPDGKTSVGDGLAATVTGEVYETSADTTEIDLPALSGAGSGLATPAATPATTTH